VHDHELITEGMELGVLAYVLKDDDIADCLRALHLLLRQALLSPSLFSGSCRADRMDALRPEAGPGPVDGNRTQDSRLIAEDLTSKEIATGSTAVCTRSTPISGNLSKLGLSGTHSLLKFAYDVGRAPGRMTALPAAER
jgi:DNA-binding NarL/FixJ family response regulator